MKDVASLISAVTFLIALTAVIVVFVRPPLALREFLRSLHELVSAVKRVKVGNVEAELRDGDTAQAVTGALPPTPAAAPIEKPATSGEVPSDAPASELPPSPTDEFWRAVGLAHERKYDEALGIVETLTANNEATRVWQIAFVQYISANEGVERALPALRQTLVRYPSYASVRSLMVDALAERGEINAAESLLQEGLAGATEDADRVRLVIRLARLFRESDRRTQAVSLLKQHAAAETELHHRAALYSALAETYRNAVPADMNAAFAMYELALLTNPGDTDTRYSAAYAYHQHGQSAMALFHYMEILGHKADTGARNNAGVAARALSLPILATRFQRQAATEGHTLAASNLAFELIGVGFIEEATALLTAAKQAQRPHERVALAEAQITTSSDTEEQNRKTLKTNVGTLGQWRQKHARAILTTLTADVSGTYRGANVTLALTARVDALEGVMSVVGEPRRVAFSGTANGAAAEYTWKTERPADGSYYYPEEGYGLLIFTPPTIIGFRLKGTNRDAVDLGNLIEFTVVKSEESGAD